MLSQRTVETSVGLFLLAAIASLLVLAFKVSGLTSFFKQDSYVVTAEFDDIGQLKARAAVKIGGVLIGEVSQIVLDPQTFRAVVSMRIRANVNDIPDDSSAAILTAGLLGDNFIAISPMYNSTFLKQGSVIQDTHSAMILEKLIGQFLFKVGGSGSAKNDPNGGSDTTTNSAEKPAANAAGKN